MDPKMLTEFGCEVLIVDPLSAVSAELWGRSCFVIGLKTM